MQLHPYIKSLSRFCVTEAPIVLGDTIYSPDERIELLQKEPLVSAYLTLCLNTRSIIMFDRPLVNAEILHSDGNVRLNLLDKAAIPASDIGPIALEAWETDLIHNARRLPGGQISIDEPMEIFREFLSEQPNLVPFDAMVAPFYASEIISTAEIIESGKNDPGVAATHNIGAHIVHIIRERTAESLQKERAQERNNANEVRHG